MCDLGVGRRWPSASQGSGPEWGNTVSGTVHGPVVQARSIHGDVVFSLAVPARMPVPGQLLPVPQNFTNRSRELALLHGLLGGPEPARPVTLAVITGVGGVGKTSLALRWLHQVREQYPAGQLYADLGGHRPDAAGRPAVVLG